jgi:hypothetical protein
MEMVLDHEGIGKLNIWNTAGKELVKIGAISEEKYLEQTRVLCDDIRFGDIQSEKNWKEKYEAKV